MEHWSSFRPLQHRRRKRRSAPNARSALAATAAREVANCDIYAPPSPIPFELSNESESEDDEHTGRGSVSVLAPSLRPAPTQSHSRPSCRPPTLLSAQTSPLQSQTPRSAAAGATSLLGVDSTSPGDA
ncbi:hypothetical protein FRC12_003400 [Ceratobasidium sp. 428]|nr:hypothetical protein FRC12_003400 [Ceratobasidium sp. 428]